MIIQGTDKIRGCMIMSNPKLELKRNQQARLSDEDANKPELQTAIAAGYVKVIESASNAKRIPSSSSPKEEEKIRCRNVYEKPLGINLMSIVNGKLEDPFPQGIQPNADFFLTSAQLNSPDVREAIQNGYIKVIKDPTKKETTLNLKDLANKAQEKAVVTDAPLDTNEEISMPTKVVEQTAKTHTESPKRNLRHDVIDTPNPEPVEADDVVGRKTVVWNPGNAPMPFNKKTTDDLSFVDEEQESKRRQSHPVLKDKPAEKEKEITFVDQIQEEQRIQEHPVLKNKPSDACDIDLA